MSLWPPFCWDNSETPFRGTAGGAFGQWYFNFNIKSIIMTNIKVLARVCLQSLKIKLGSCSFICLYCFVFVSVFLVCILRKKSFERPQLEK